MPDRSPWKSDFLFRQLPLPALLLRVEGGALLLAEVNPAAERSNPGLPALLGRSMRALYADQPELIEAVEQCLREGGAVVRELDVRRYDRASTNQRIRFSLARLSSDHLLVSWQDVTPAAMATAALREEEERYRSVVAVMSEGVVVQGPDGRVLAINPAAERILGIAAQAAVGWAGMGAVLAEWPAMRTFASGVPVCRETVVAPLSTGLRHLSVTTQVLGAWGTGSFRGVVTTFQDVTDQARAEEALRASEERYRQIVETTSEGIWIADLDGRIVFANPQLARLLGCEVSEVVGSSAYEWLHPDDHARARLNLHRRARGLSDTLELTYVRRDGSLLPASVAASPLYEAGRVVGSLAMVRDRSDLRTAQLALQGSEGRLQEVLEAARLGFWEWDAQTDRTWWSPNLETTFGPPLQRGLVGFLGRLHPEDRPAAAALAERLLERGTPGETFEIEVRLATSDGELRWARLSGRVFREGDHARFGGLFQDITQRRSLEARLHAVDRMESIGRLAGGVAHDFNNLIGVIAMAGSALEDGATPDQREDLATIQMAAARSRALTQQLLALARRQPIELHLVDASRVVSGLQRILARMLRRDIALDLDLPAAPCPVRVDPGQLEQVIVNLVVNARDAMPDGGRIGITVRERAADAPRPDGLHLPPGPAVCITVTDTGDGIADAALPHLFEPFFTTKETGTGLGLASSYGILRQFGGDLVARNLPQGGASFEAWLACAG